MPADPAWIHQVAQVGNWRPLPTAPTVNDMRLTGLATSPARSCQRLRAGADLSPGGVVVAVLVVALFAFDVARAAPDARPTPATAAATTLEVVEDETLEVTLIVAGDRAPTFQVYPAAVGSDGATWTVELPAAMLTTEPPPTRGPGPLLRGVRVEPAARGTPARVELSFFAEVDFDARTDDRALRVRFTPTGDRNALLAAHRQRQDAVAQLAALQQAEAARLALEQQHAAEARAAAAAAAVEAEREAIAQKKADAERRVALARVAEERRRAEEARLADERRRVREERRAEQERRVAEARAAREQKRAEKLRVAEEARLAHVAQSAEQEQQRKARAAELARQQAEARLLAEQQALAARAADEARRAEASAREEHLRAEEARLLAEQRAAEEASAAAARAMREEQRRAEASRQAALAAARAAERVERERTEALRRSGFVDGVDDPGFGGQAAARYVRWQPPVDDDGFGVDGSVDEGAGDADDGFGGDADEVFDERAGLSVLTKLTVQRTGRGARLGVVVDGGARYDMQRRRDGALLLTLYGTRAANLAVRRILDARALDAPILRVLPSVDEDDRFRVRLLVETRGQGAVHVGQEGRALWLEVEQ